MAAGFAVRILVHNSPLSLGLNIGTTLVSVFIVHENSKSHLFCQTVNPALCSLSLSGQCLVPDL
jgi:hypothetical protein